MGRAHSSEERWTLGSQGAGNSTVLCCLDPAATCDALNIVCPPRFGSTNAALTSSGLPFQHLGTPTSILSPNYVPGQLPL
ncbi:jg21842 [Pararge aegeria aegeria]|uniref:Jg21842 protein n=1 Tax=Pararge aegeria aegeria TaxID=348720 RepID=A0A8S4QGI9_9NEOP|nr:jg21842 [Pararge aegeria aegeria]